MKIEAVIQEHKRIVVKVGSSLLTDKAYRINEGYIALLAAELSKLIDVGHEVVLVTSGAIAAGVDKLHFAARPPKTEIAALQAAASVGQAALIDSYARAFAQHDKVVGQILLTRSDTAQRDSYLHARNTLEKLLELSAVPIVNENDTVAVDEIKFGDNDSLAALVSGLIQADLMIIMSDIEGLYTANPHTHPKAELIEEIREVSQDIMALAGDSLSAVGTGGMYTKLKAAQIMMLAGIEMVICRGHDPGILPDLISGKARASYFRPRTQKQSVAARKLWIALGDAQHGSLIVDEGAVRALQDLGSSLLCVGLKQLMGKFEAGDTVQILDEHGNLIARGLSSFSSQQAWVCQGMNQEMIARVYPELAHKALVHRDELVMLR